MSASFTMLYLSKTLRVLCPVIIMDVFSGTPALTRFRAAVRRKSWRIFPGSSARSHAAVHEIVARLDTAREEYSQAAERAGQLTSEFGIEGIAPLPRKHALLAAERLVALLGVWVERVQFGAAEQRSLGPELRVARAKYEEAPKAS